MLTWRLLCSSVLVMTCFLIWDDHILTKKELHRRPQVDCHDGSCLWEGQVHCMPVTRTVQCMLHAAGSAGSSHSKLT